jgi:hypothetical protein
VRVFAKAFANITHGKLHTAHSIEEALEVVAKLQASNSK